MMSSRTVKGWCLGAALCLALGITVLLPGRALAHAFLDRSEPSANAVIPEPPTEVRLWFTEPVEARSTRAELYDATGRKIETPPSQIGDEPNQVILPLPADLPRGTYTVQWRNISAADGHPEVGYVPFTIGSQADVVVPDVPLVASASGPPTWVAATGQWLGLLGITGAAGMLLCWLLVIQPSLEPLPPEQSRVVRRWVRRGALVCVGIALIGSVVALGVQAATASESLSLASVGGVLRESRFGGLWLIRVGLLLALAVVLNEPWPWRGPAGARAVVIGAIGLAAMLPYALNSHAAAQSTGSAAAVAADWLHLVATSVWVGGLLALVIGLVIGTRGMPREQARALYAGTIPRFSTLGIASLIVLSLTGFYAAWLEVGNIDALLETGYGQALAVKLALIVPLVGLGALNLFVVGPWMRRSADATGQFRRTVVAEAVLGVAVIAVVGVLTSLPTAREALASTANSTVFHLAQGGRRATLQITPGVVGFNQYTVALDSAGDASAPDTEVLLRISRDGDIQGIREIQLLRAGAQALADAGLADHGDHHDHHHAEAAAPVDGNRFEASGSELSVVGDWQLELIVRRPGAADWRASVPVEIGATPPEQDLPGPPPRFAGAGGAVGMLLGGLAVALVVVGARQRTWPVLGGGVLVALASILALALTIA